MLPKRRTEVRFPFNPECFLFVVVVCMFFRLCLLVNVLYLFTDLKRMFTVCLRDQWQGEKEKFVSSINNPVLLGVCFILALRSTTVSKDLQTTHKAKYLVFLETVADPSSKQCALLLKLINGPLNIRFVFHFLQIDMCVS